LLSRLSLDLKSYQNRQKDSPCGLEVCYFSAYHHSLRENTRIDLIHRYPGSQVLIIKFLPDKKRIAVSLSSGLILIVNSTDLTIHKILFCSSFVNDRIKFLSSSKLITCGIDSKVRIWNFEQEKIVDKINLHTYAVTHLVLHNDWVYMATTENIMYRYSI
jgi:WD40 repeat protein